MGNTFGSESWAAEICNPRRNVMTVDHDISDGYKPTPPRNSSGTAPSADCCGEICTPRRSVTSMQATTSKDQKSSICLGQDCPSDTRQAIEALCSRSSGQSDVSGARRGDGRRGYAPPFSQGMAVAQTGSPRGAARGEATSYEAALNPRHVSLCNFTNRLFHRNVSLKRNQYANHCPPTNLPSTNTNRDHFLLRPSLPCIACRSLSCFLPCTVSLP